MVQSSDAHLPVTPATARLAMVKAYAVLTIGGVFLGFAPVIVKALTMSADISAFYRVALSTPLLLLWALYAPRSVKKPADKNGKRVVILYALAAFFFAADLGVMHLAIRSTNVTIATLFTNCAPFFIGVFGLLGLSERPQRSFWSALPLAMGGTILLIGISGFAQGGGSIAGDAMALLAGLLYAAYLVTVRKLRQSGAASGHIMAVVAVGSTLFLSVLFFLAGTPVPATLRDWLLLLALVLIGQVAGQGLVTIALQRLPVSSSSLVLLIQPVVAAIFSWLLLHEALSPLQIFGVFLVLVSIFIALRPAHTL